MRRRVWCETLSYEALPAHLGLLARHRLDLLLAVRPWQLPEVSELVRRLRGEGLFVGVWPMIADEQGRWANARSCTEFIAFTDELLARVPFADEVVLDLEPPYFQLARLRPGHSADPATKPPRQSFGAARDAYAAATRRWRAERRVTTAVIPAIAFEVAGQWMQRVLGTPTTALDVDCHSLMAYTSLFEGWSRGLLGRRRAEQLLVACARLGRRRFGASVGLSLGTVGAGAFGDEPSYRNPAELARDVELATAAGITELALFDLGGIVRRGPAEAWLDAFAGEV